MSIYTRDFERWVLKNHRDIFVPLIIFGHHELLTDEITDEYVEYYKEYLDGVIEETDKIAGSEE